MVHAVRWLGAFRHGANTLRHAFEFEFAATREVAAEWWDTNLPQNWCESAPSEDANLTRAIIGLRIARRAITRRFHNDAWTEPQGPRLVPTRHGSYYHTEAICKPQYDAIVLRERSLGMIAPRIRADIEWAACKWRLPIVVLRDGRFVNN